MKRLKELEDVLMKEVGRVSAKGDITPAEIHPMYEIVDMIKDIETIFAMKEYGKYEDDYSGVRGSRPYYHSMQGYSRNGYSEKLRHMADTAEDPRIREMLISCAERMER